MHLSLLISKEARKYDYKILSQTPSESVYSFSISKAYQIKIHEAASLHDLYIVLFLLSVTC